MTEWINMGGYGSYLWPAYGISVLALGALVAWSWRGYFAAKARAAALEGRPLS